MKLLREPLVHFLFIGAAIYLAYGLLAEPVEEDTAGTLVVSAGEIEWMQTAWRKRWNRPPTDGELDGLVQQYIRETVLYREALAMGLDKEDAVIRRRLAQKLEFLARDLVALAPPTDEALQAYFNEHLQRYTQPEHYTFTQVYFDPDKRGDATLDDARAIKTKLTTRSVDDEQASTLGDGFMLENYYPEKSQEDIRKLFGSGFAVSVSGLSPGEWHGPVLSGYGVHLVYVHSVSEARSPVLAEIHERVAQNWKTDKGEELNKQFYANLRDRYTVVIEEPDEDETLAASQEKTP
ncbi:MAG: peptidyl-prolyl cis-trans isomerase [Pseudomonadota bacterium]|nr:peptidyl-prolyl cis-trans isomerase [Pseudomonadota bacterium]